MISQIDDLQTRLVAERLQAASWMTTNPELEQMLREGVQEIDNLWFKVKQLERRLAMEQKDLAR